MVSKSFIGRMFNEKRGPVCSIKIWPFWQHLLFYETIYQKHSYLYWIVLMVSLWGAQQNSWSHRLIKIHRKILQIEFFFHKDADQPLWFNKEDSNADVFRWFCAILKNISEHLQEIACEQSGCLASNILFKSNN